MFNFFIKKTLIICLAFFLLIGFVNPVAAFTEEIILHYFYLDGCPACHRADQFLNALEEKYPQININRYSITDPENKKLLEKLAREAGAERYIGIVPIMFIKDTFFLGFESYKTTGKDIENYIQEQLQNREPNNIKNEKNQNILLPIIGEINPERFSLASLAIVLGFLDGFNICSLSALILILSLVIGLRSRRKILFFGSLFILTTTITYGILMSMWFHFFTLLGEHLRNFQIIIGVLSIIGGGYFLSQYIKFRKKAPVCEMGGKEKITAKLLKNIQELIKNQKNILLVIGSVLSFSFLITIIEFPCSAAVPVVFTGILAEAQLPGIAYLFYIALFLLFYMLDEIIIFLIAVFTMKIWLASGKFVTYATLAQGIILSALGVYYLFGI